MADERWQSGTFKCADNGIQVLLVGERASWQALVASAPPELRFEYCQSTQDALLELGDGRPRTVLFHWQHTIDENFCRCARALWSELVLIAVTAGPATEARLAAFEAGADDCVGYDTDVREVLARVQAIARRRRNAPRSQSLELRAEVLSISFGLSARERETLVQLALGVHSKQIGAAIGCEYSTVRTHLRRICKKLGCSGTREALVRFFAYDIPYDTEAASPVPKLATGRTLSQKSK